MNYTRYSFTKAHEILWKLGYWKYLFIPILLSLALAIVLGLSCYFMAALVSSSAREFVENFVDLPSWIGPIFTLVVFVLCLGPCYIFFRSLVMLCYGPFLDKLSAKAEEVMNNEPKELKRGFVESLKRPMMMATFTISVSLVLLFAGFLLGLIPLAGFIVSIMVTFPLQVYLSSLAYIDPYLDRCGYSPIQSMKLLRSHFRSVFFFGVVGLLMTFVPIVGWFVGPTYSVVAGIIFGILIVDETQNTVFGQG